MSDERFVFSGCMPALMTPCDQHGQPDFAVLVETAQRLMDRGMSAVVYCGSMGDWPLLTIEQRQQGVEALVEAHIPVVVGTGAPSTREAVMLAAHAGDVGAQGLMIIPRILSRGSVPAAQVAHFSAVLSAADQLPVVIYNSPYYGYETGADLFFQLRERHPNLVGFKEFGGQQALTDAAEHITGSDAGLSLMVGVDTQVLHGFVHCNASGAITGVGNALPDEVLHFINLCQAAARGDHLATTYATQLDAALRVLATFDEGPDLVLYYKHLMELAGHRGYRHHLNATDRLTVSQQAFVESEWQRFKQWWHQWPGKDHPVTA